MAGHFREGRDLISLLKKTTAPAPADFGRGFGNEIRRRGQPIDDGTLALIIERAGNIPGQALRPVMKAELMQVPLTRAFIEEFRWEI